MPARKYIQYACEEVHALGKPCVGPTLPNKACVPLGLPRGLHHSQASHGFIRSKGSNGKADERTDAQQMDSFLEQREEWKELDPLEVGSTLPLKSLLRRPVQYLMSQLRRM